MIKKFLVSKEILLEDLLEGKFILYLKERTGHYYFSFFRKCPEA